MSEMFGVGYFPLVALVVVCGLFSSLLRSLSASRSAGFPGHLLFALPPLALVVHLMLKVLRITITVRTENASHV
ncbi:MAG TPA: hypothetical protein VFN25_16715 [Dokdonella sp.]|uniref:hypothetical protein n=1 Tax=Dokdonella sp. TaxID=2291710 RepID=UPI002D7EA440|nr:hypothetical protein [Dokdonella sp.]HET9034532.1 hypothetical protein [Dokdonella sp.]